MKKFNSIFVFIYLSIYVPCVNGQNTLALQPDSSVSRLSLLCNKWELYKTETHDPMNRLYPVRVDSIKKSDMRHETYAFFSNGRYQHERSTRIEKGIWISDKEITMLGLFVDSVNGVYNSDYDENKNKPGFGCPKFCAEPKIWMLNDIELALLWSGDDSSFIYYFRLEK